MINNPPLREPFGSVGWQTWFMQVFYVCFAVEQSGTSAQRPTKRLFIGRTYFDTTVGVPIWWNGTIWIDATGGAA